MKGSVLLTGGTGFIGRATADLLISQGWQVYLAKRAETAENWVDLEKTASFVKLMEGARMDAIVHLAAKIELGNSTEDKLFATNVAGTANLLLLAQRWKARLIFASTAIVCGARTPHITTSSPVNPDTVYGRSKWLAEQLIVASGVDAMTLRLSGVFGADGPAHLGLNRTIDAALKESQRPQLVGSGGARRNYIYVRDAATAIAYALESNMQGVHYVAGAETMTIKEMLDSLCQILLPGRDPMLVAGGDAADQVIEPSPFLPSARPFREALIDIASRA
jgi:nucleoside-diphosphate-sugar epimerase